MSQSAGHVLQRAHLHDSLIAEQRRSRALMSLLVAQDEYTAVEPLIARMVSVAAETLNAEKAAHALVVLMLTFAAVFCV